MQKIIKTIFLVLIFINICYVFAGVVFHPLQSMDAIGIWFFKAKAIHLEHGFPNQFLHNPMYNYSHQQYPIGLPFILSVIWGFGEKQMLLLYPAIYTSIIILVYWILRRTTDQTNALIFTYIYAMLSPLIAGGGRLLAGNADIILVLINWIIIFLFYQKKLTVKRILLIVLLIMLSSQIKLEGAFISVLLLWMPIPKKQRIFFFFIALIPFLIWITFVKVLKIPSDTHLILPSFDLLLQRIPSIVRGALQELININNWYLFWPSIFLLTFTNSKLSTQLKRSLLPAYGVIMCLYLSIYLFASNDAYTYITSSFDRILLQQSPIVFLFFFEKLSQLFPIRESSNKHPSKQQIERVKL